MSSLVYNCAFYLFYLFLVRSAPFPKELNKVAYGISERRIGVEIHPWPIFAHDEVIKDRRGHSTSPTITLHDHRSRTSRSSSLR